MIGLLERPRVFFGAAVLFCVAVMAITAVRVYPFVDDVNARQSAGDDWLTYKNYALDVLDHGLAIPSVRMPYYTPGGFLYVYFVAAIFEIAGRNATYVYVVQGLLLAITIVVSFAVARRFLSPPLAIAFFFITSWALAVDVYHYTTLRLLSENLVLPLIALAVWLTIEARRRDSMLWYAAAGILLGSVVLTRVNLQLVPFGVALVVILYSRGRYFRGLLQGGLVLVFAFLVFSLLGFRNAAVAGHFTFRSPDYAKLFPTVHGLALARLLGERTLYCAGVLIGGFNMDMPRILVAKRFVVLTVAAIAYVLFAMIRRRLEFIDALCVAWIVLAYGPFIVLPALGAYGMRFQWPTEPLLILLACRGADVAMQYVRRLRGHATAAQPA